MAGVSGILRRVPNSCRQKETTRTPIRDYFQVEICVGGSLPVAPKKKSVEPRTLTEPPARGEENVPWPTPLSGRGDQGTASLHETCRFSVKQSLDARASVQVVADRLAVAARLYPDFKISYTSARVIHGFTWTGLRLYRRHPRLNLRKYVHRRQSAVDVRTPI